MLGSGGSQEANGHDLCRGGGRRGAACCALALAAGGSAEGRALIDVKLASASQKQILDAGAVTVEVSSEEAGKVRVRGAAGSGKVAKVAKPRIVRLKAGKTITVKLPLTDAGRTRIAGCGEQDVLIRARATEAGDRLGDRDDDRDKTRQALARDSAACAATSPPTDGGGGGWR